MTRSRLNLTDLSGDPFSFEFDRLEWKTAKGTKGKPQRGPVENRKGDQWKTVTGTSGKPLRGSKENRKGDQGKTAKGTSGKPQHGPVENRQGGAVENCKGMTNTKLSCANNHKHFEDA